MLAGEGEIKDNDKDGDESPSEATAQRLDKWLWFARMAKTRSLAQRLVTEGNVRINRERAVKPSQTVKMGDMVSVELGRQLRLLEVLTAGTRRGPASEAAGLYRDLAPKPERAAAAEHAKPNLGERDAGAGRPTKLERRRLDRLRDR